MERDTRNDAERMAEAANRPLDFQPKERAQYVRDSIDLVEKYQRHPLPEQDKPIAYCHCLVAGLVQWPDVETPHQTRHQTPHWYQL